jgi:hypothetical protein
MTLGLLHKCKLVHLFVAVCSGIHFGENLFFYLCEVAKLGQIGDTPIMSHLKRGQIN